MTAAERLVARGQTPVRFTADEFMELVRHPPVSDWVGKIELIDGEIVRLSPGHIPHWSAQRSVALQLHSVFDPLGPAWLAGQEPTVRFGKRSVRLPDVAVFRTPKLTASIFDVADLFLAVEIADTTLRHDLGRKQVAHAEAAVPHYWVVDVNGRKVHVMADPEAVGYATRRVIPFGEPIHVPGADATILVD